MGKTLSFQTKKMLKIKFCYAAETFETQSRGNVIKNASEQLLSAS